MEVTDKQIEQYKIAFEKQKIWCKKYHMSEKGKQKRREAQKRYYYKQKNKSNQSINAVPSS